MANTLRKYLQGKYLLAVTTYIMVGAVFVRTYLYYPEVLLPAFSLLMFLVILLLIEPIIIHRSQIIWAIYLVLQISVMVSLFFLEPDGDTFSLLLLPACIFAMRHYEQLTGWIWIIVFSLFMAIMLFYGHQEFAPALIVIYLAAYFLVASFSLVIKQNEIAQQKLVAAVKQLRSYAEQVEDLTAINERNHLARELHDSVTQTIFSMTLITRSALILHKREPAQVSDKLVELQELSQNALKEMRTLVTQLRPLSISDDGLYPVLGKHIDELNRRNDVDITLDVEEACLVLDVHQQQEIFRLIQEALNNVTKHAHAQRAYVACKQTDGKLRVTVTDDGRGFDTKSPIQGQLHFGLESMRQRAMELGGTLEIESKPGSGTKVICTIPLHKDDMTHG